MNDNILHRLCVSSACGLSGLVHAATTRLRDLTASRSDIPRFGDYELFMSSCRSTRFHNFYPNICYLSNPPTGRTRYRSTLMTKKKIDNDNTETGFQRRERHERQQQPDYQQNQLSINRPLLSETMKRDISSPELAPTRSCP